MLIALVANPHSGGATEPGEIERALAADGARVRSTAIDALVSEPDAGLDAERVAAGVRELSADGRPDRVVVAGGDGSIGPVALLAAELGVPLAVVAAGTANDFARALKLPTDLAAACALARAPGARTRPAELATAGKRPFVNAASAGLSVLAAREAKPYKARLGALAYAVGALRAGATASPLPCRVVGDGEERFSGKVWQVVVGVTGAFGGGSEIGGTVAGDEQLDTAVIPAGSRAALAWRALGMRTGRLTAQSDVAHVRAAVVELELPPGTALNVDGEVCRRIPYRFALRPGGFEVVVP